MLKITILNCFVCFSTICRENLQRLLEDKSFKEEIVNFSISEENAIVKPIHRTDLMPVLMRYVFNNSMKNITTSGRDVFL